MSNRDGPQTRGGAFAALRRRADVRRLAAAARRVGVDAWIVGGALRDAALGLPLPELDAAVSRDAESVARALESAGAGRAVFLSRDRPGPRVFRVAGARPIDVAEIEGGSIAADLGRRDFTVNALALEAETGALLDPFGGRDDLVRRRLRLVRAQNFRDDPLRAIRAARFIATHGLSPDAGVRRAARAVAPLLSGVAAERVGAELAKLLSSARAAPALAWAAGAGLAPGLLRREIPAAASRALTRALQPLDRRPARGRAPERLRRLRLARLAERLGDSGADARRWLARLRWGRRESDEVARLVDLAASATRARTTRAAWRWVIDAGPLAADALLLARISSRSRALERLARLSRRPLRRVAVRGGDVIRWLRVAPGPDVGRWLSEVALAAAIGEVKNRREARDWLSVQVRGRARPAIIGAH